VEELFFCQLLNLIGVREDRQIEIHTSEPLLPEPGSFEVYIAIVKYRCEVMIKFWQN
jgi:hypothetical protein